MSWYGYRHRKEKTVNVVVRVEKRVRKNWINYTWELPISKAEWICHISLPSDYLKSHLKWWKISDTFCILNLGQEEVNIFCPVRYTSYKYFLVFLTTTSEVIQIWNACMKVIWLWEPTVLIICIPQICISHIGSSKGELQSTPSADVHCYHILSLYESQ